MSNEEIALLAGAIGAAGAVLGALVSGVVSYLIQRRKARDEHGAWLRQQRFDACANMLAVTYQYVALGPDERPSRAEVLAASSRAQMLLNATVASAAAHLQADALAAVHTNLSEAEERRERFYELWHDFAHLVRSDVGFPPVPPDGWSEAEEAAAYAAGRMKRVPQ